jgi:hypothetical protein
LKVGALEGFVDVADDRVGLVQLKAIVLERRHLAERMAGEMLGRRVGARENVDLDEIVRSTLLFQRKPTGPSVGAVGWAVDDGFGHNNPP